MDTRQCKVDPVKTARMSTQSPLTNGRQSQKRKLQNGTPLAAVATPDPVAATRNLREYTYANMSAAEVQRSIARPRVEFQSILSTVGASMHALKFTFNKFTNESDVQNLLQEGQTLLTLSPGVY